ncbi:MAG: NAD-dependent epimerase/dehydratase family protein [Anaerolineae bacterium]|nr:NAD-dependent epimerase/dehydratase family protein [Anaerolineae bacterium]NIQ80157.1 NAD-dependent epimerase/dehydratase family protein [Anaerolineae bacterium]
MRCAVTGGSGFIGSHVVDQLKGAGHEVVVIDCGVQPHCQDVEFFDVDVVDYAALREATKGCDYVFHLAAVSNVNHAFEDPLRCVAVNIQGTANALEAARQNKAERLVLASTVWVYTGAPGHDVAEDSPFYLSGAGHIYTSSKIADEMMCHDYGRLYDLPFTILRYGIPYGPRMREALVIPVFLKKAFGGEPITITGDGSQYRNFVYVEDLARAHLLVMDGRAEKETYNLEGMRKVTIREIAETIDGLLGGHVKIEYLPARPGDYGGKEVSADKARRELGWEPAVDFEDGMKRTLSWFRAQWGFE